MLNSQTQIMEIIHYSLHLHVLMQLELDLDPDKADMGAYPYDQIANPIIWGCMDEEACNYDQEAMNDDDCIYFTDLCGVYCGDSSSCDIISDIDGNEYGTVEIGNQTWMNLKTSRYNNGDEIPSNLDNSECVQYITRSLCSL